MRGKNWAKWLLAFMCWTVLALIFASQAYVYSAASGEGKDWTPIFLWTLADWYIWGLLSPLILLLARRFRFERCAWRRALLVHLPASLLFALLHLALHSIVQSFIGMKKFEGGGAWSAFLYLFTKKIHLDLLTYWAIVGISHGAFFYRRYHERAAQAHKLKAQAHKLEAELALSQLQTLQMQLHPHFLFNTLHTISELIHRDPQAADRMVARLGDLLRLTLEREAAQEVPLREELEFLEKYLEIERTRFHDRLAVEMKVDPQALDAQVPNMILQPLVENAIKHGLAARPGAGRIEISAESDGGELRLAVRDDGVGLPDGWAANGGRERIGLRNTRRRLEQLYDGQHRFELRNREGGGSEALLVIPLRKETTAGGSRARGARE